MVNVTLNYVVWETYDLSACVLYIQYCGGITGRTCPEVLFKISFLIQPNAMKIVG
jgi:hypothetical protein